MKIKFSNIVSTLQVGHLSELKKHIYDIVIGELNWFLVKHYREDIWDLIIYEVATGMLINKNSHALDYWDDATVKKFLGCGCKESEFDILLGVTGVYDEFARQCAGIKHREIINKHMKGEV